MGLANDFAKEIERRLGARFRREAWQLIVSGAVTEDRKAYSFWLSSIWEPDNLVGLSKEDAVKVFNAAKKYCLLTFRVEEVEGGNDLLVKFMSDQFGPFSCPPYNSMNSSTNAS